MILDDTICAIATAAGGAARGMVRISGPAAVHVVSKVFHSTEGPELEDVRAPTAIAGYASVELYGERVHTLPCDAFVWPTARSYTRQPVVELHTLGSPPLLESLVASICDAGARLAEPGEFTLRAFLAGRIDLTQAEAVLGVIDARNNAELTTALTQLAGGLARPLQLLRDNLLQLLAELEAGLDFVEEDIEFISKAALLARLDAADRALVELDQQLSSRTTSTGATQVAIAGAPNAGKSSLFNALVALFGQSTDSSTVMPSRAIVSPRRGTTRDYLTAMIEIGGARFELLDTAGVDADEAPREKLSLIDATAQSLAAERGAAAAIHLWCIDATETASNADEMPIAPSGAPEREIIVLTKCDLSAAPQHALRKLKNAAVVATSSRTGEGLDELSARLRDFLETEQVAQQGRAVAATAERSRESIRLAQSAISRARKIIDHESGDELAAAELRVALTELGKVVGAVYTDDLLDRVFSTFCIGK